MILTKPKPNILCKQINCLDIQYEFKIHEKYIWHQF
jgi:hypothetical protein